MFAKISPVAALAILPWTNALLLQIPVNWHSSSVVNVSWTNNPTDPTFSLQLANIKFHNTFAVASNLNPSTDFASFELGVVPAPDTYTLRAINVTNENQIYDETPSFTIQSPLVSTTSTSPSSSSGATSSSSSSSASSGSSSNTLTVTSGTQPAASSTPFGTTVSGSSTSVGTNVGSVIQSGTSSSSSPTSQPSNFNGAATIPRFAPYAAAALGLVAGAAVAL